ncbi:MAG TPA: FkbM family methyltransferase [Rhodothermales bacterium]|nr:FkbM family methyltransferase [Rhodothermales bacterium]
MLRTAARIAPGLRRYPARLDSGDRLYVDLAERMCHGLFLYGGQPHEYGTEKLMRAVLRPGAVVADVGANVGYYTRLAAHLVGPTGAVHAFEPTPHAYRLLELNAADLPCVQAHRLALSDHDGETTIYVRASGDLSSLAGGDGAEAVPVRVARLDTALAGVERLDFLKVDVEGFEPEVLRGAQRAMEVHRPVVTFEYLDEFAAERGFGLADFDAMLEPLGYTRHWIDHSPQGPLFGLEPTTYVVAVPAGWTPPAP